MLWQPGLVKVIKIIYLFLSLAPLLIQQVDFNPHILTLKLNVCFIRSLLTDPEDNYTSSNKDNVFLSGQNVYYNRKKVN